MGRGLATESGLWGSKLRKNGPYLIFTCTGCLGRLSFRVTKNVTLIPG
ncbi:MAG: hypothetical protein RL518_2110 [Pseudomonadota bacterium]|jgi:hypothetical protein